MVDYAVVLLQYGAYDENAILLLLHLGKVSDDGLTDCLSECLAALLKDPLDNPAAELVKTERHNILLDGSNYGAHAGWLRWMTHLDDDLLHDVVAVEVEGAVLNSISFNQLLHELFLLAIGKHFEARLQYSTAMLVGWEVVDAATEMPEDNVEVLAVDPSNLLDFLYDVVTKRILNQLVKSDGRIFEEVV